MSRRLFALLLLAPLGCGPTPTTSKPTPAAPAVVPPTTPTTTPKDTDPPLTTHFPGSDPNWRDAFDPKPTQPADPKPDVKAQREVEQYVVKAGGAVFRDEDPNSKQRGVVLTVKLPEDCGQFELKRLAVFPKLNRLSVSDSGGKNTDAVLKQLGDLPTLTSLSLADTDATDAGMLAVAAHPALKDLDLTRVKLTAAGWKALAASKSLQSLDATETAIDDAAVKELGAVKTLTKVTLKGTKVTLKGTGSAFAAWDKLTELDLRECPLTDESLVPVGVAKALQVLKLSEADITDAALKPLNQCAKLKALTIEGSAKLTGTGFADLDALTGLELLYLGGSGITDAGMAFVARRTGVKTLSLERTKITDAGMKELASPRGLEKLSVEETGVTDIGLLVVAEKAKKLTQVDARKSKITKKGADDASKKLPDLVVSFE